MRVVCWASAGSPSIMPRLASSSRSPSQLAHPHNRVQKAPVFGLLEDKCSVFHRIFRKDRLPSQIQATWYNYRWLASTSTTSDAGVTLTGPKTLVEHCLFSVSQTPELVDERRMCMTQCVLEDTCHLLAMF